MGLQKCGLNLNNVSKELQPHGSLAFPCAGYASRHTDLPEDIIPWHWHEELEIIYIESGQIRVKIPQRSFLLKRVTALPSMPISSIMPQPPRRVLFIPLFSARLLSVETRILSLPKNTCLPLQPVTHLSFPVSGVCTADGFEAGSAQSGQPPHQQNPRLYP